MDPTRFDAFIRLLAGATSRRRTIAALALAMLPFAFRDDAAAGPGCKNVGKKCKRDAQCCSDVCKGGKNKRCKAHDGAGCKAGQQETACGGVEVDCISSTGAEGACDTTTGNAPYCTVDGGCFPCTKDRQCRPFCGPKAACIRCGPECEEEGGTACVGPGQCDFPAMVVTRRLAR